MSTLRSICWSLVAFTGLISFVAMSLLPAAVLGAPLVAITKPADGAVVYGYTEIQVAYRSDSEQPIVAIQLFVDGQLARHWLLPQPRLEGRQNFSWDFSFAAATTHTIKAKAIDAKGQEGSASIVVEVKRITTEAPDQIPPVINIYYPAQGAKVSGEVEIKANATDNVGVTTVFFSIDGVFKSLIVKDAPPYTDRWDTTKVADGPHVLQAKAWDAAENEAASAEVTVIVENRAMTTAKLDSSTLASTQPTPAPMVATPVPAPTALGEGVTYPRQFGSPIETAEPPTEVPADTSETETTIATLPPSHTEVATARTTQPPRLRLPVTRVAVPSRDAARGRLPQPAESPALVRLPKPRPTTVPERAQPPARASTGIETSSPGAELLLAAASLAPFGPMAVAVSHNTRPAEMIRPTRPVGATDAAPMSPVATEYQVVMLPHSTAPSRPYANRVTTPATVPAIPAAVAAVKDIKIVFDGDVLDLRAAPEAKQDISIAPLREIFEHTDGVLYWFHVEKKVHAINKDVDLRLQIGNPQVQVNDQTQTLLLAPYIKRGRTMVPLQFLADTLDVTIRFNPATGQIVVSSNDF